MKINNDVYYVLQDPLGPARAVTVASGPTLGSMLTGQQNIAGVRSLSSISSEFRQFYYFTLPTYFLNCKGQSSPYINRFIQPDTVVPNYGNPQSLNRFSYVKNSPVNYTDPTGHVECRTQEECLDMGTTPGGGFHNPQPKPHEDPPHFDLPPMVIPNLPCGGVITCDQQSPYGYVASLLPFTSSDACYFLLQDPVFCNLSSWPHFSSVAVNLPGNLPSNSLIQNYCENINGLACAANASQDVATLIDLVGVGLIEVPAVATGCIGGGPLGCAAAEIGVAATWTMTLNNAETAASGLSFLLTWTDDVANNGGWGENSATSFTTLLAGQLPLTPSWDLAVDIYSSGYNHGFFNGIYSFGSAAVFKP